MSAPDPSLKLILSWEKIPSFTSTNEEQRYWETHQASLTLLQASLTQSDTSESTTISLRIDPRMLSRIKRIARRRYLNYQSMIKQWLAERMEEELK